MSTPRRIKIFGVHRPDKGFIADSIVHASRISGVAYHLIYNALVTRKEKQYRHLDTVFKLYKK